MNAWLEVLGLFALRVGLPLLLTLLIGSWLTRLDQKWRQEKLAAPLPEAPRCWELTGCHPTTRDQCAAYQLRPLPCWLAWAQVSGKVPPQCFACPVFQMA